MLVIPSNRIQPVRNLLLVANTRKADSSPRGMTREKELAMTRRRKLVWDARLARSGGAKLRRRAYHSTHLVILRMTDMSIQALRSEERRVGKEVRLSAVT